jgi:hypothetical protein
MIMLPPAFVSLGGLIFFGVLFVATATTCVRHIGRSSEGGVDGWFAEERAERIEEGLIESGESRRYT